MKTEIDPLDPTLTEIKELCRDMLPIDPSPAVLWRWRTRGRNGAKLRTIKLGRSRYTTPAELRRFLRDQQPPHDDDNDRHARTERQLAAAGYV